MRMELAGYNEQFMRSQSRQNVSFTQRLEEEAKTLCGLLVEKRHSPSGADLQRVKNFLVDVEKWKADCLEELTGHAMRNDSRAIWNALLKAIEAGNDDLTALQSIMTLIGFGSSKDEKTGQRRAKRATAVLRFLDPEQWGVVDWRTVALLGLYEKHNSDMDEAVQHARKISYREAARLYDIIDEEAALDIVRRYRDMRCPRLPRTVDVEVAIYGASFIAWPRLKR